MIAPGVRRVGDALVAERRVGSWRKGTVRGETRKFALDCDLAEIERWRLRTRADLMESQPDAPVAGTVAADIAAFVDSLPDGNYKRETRSIMKHWTASKVATMARPAVQYAHVNDQVSRWVESNVPASTINKRLSRFRKMYANLDGPTAATPADKIERQQEPDLEPRDIPARICRLILDSLQDRGRAAKGDTRPKVGLSKIRLRIWYYTGATPATQKRVDKRHLDLAGARVFLLPRDKGKRRAKPRQGAWFPLNPPAVAAWRAFAAADLFHKSYSATSIAKTFRVGVAAARRRAVQIAAESNDPSWLADLDLLPPDVSPYDLRHSFATQSYEQSGDIRAVAALLQHSDLRMVERYTKGAVAKRVALAVAAAADSFTNIPTPPEPKPAQPLRLVNKAG